jgi:isocitrate dehydrogenase
MEEYHLKSMYKSPNATIRAILDGTVFRAPVLVKNIKPIINSWTKPIVIARHAYGDIYKCVETRVDKGYKAELNIIGSDEKSQTVYDFKSSSGIVMAMHNTDESIKSFARSCFTYALNQKMDLWFSTKDTISKIYDGRFKSLFNDIYEKEFKLAFEQNKISYFYTLIDDAVARIVRSNGGMIWALKNYDGDVMSDMVATAFGSLAMMTSVLVSPDGKYEFEAAHGTVTKHYYKYLNGEETSTNPIATIFAWSGALRKRGELDKNNELIDYANNLEKASLLTIEKGIVTKDLYNLVEGDKDKIKILKSEDFINAIANNLKILIN